MSRSEISTDIASLIAREEALRGVLDAARGRLDQPVADSVVAELDIARERLGHAMDRTIVALLGGTGSGKSSLFNALTDLQFAEVSVRRPTTAQVMACIWGEATPDLLDWLDIPGDRRVQRVSALDGDDQADLNGLVLLDLPDHDSIATEHRREVDRLLPMADVLLWVLDPQKYADESVHARYLQALTGQDRAILVVLNQSDLLGESDLAAVIADVDRLLAADGLPGIATRAVSARTERGIAELRDELVRMVSGGESAPTRVAVTLDGAALRLREVLDGRPVALPRAEVVRGLVELVDPDAAAAVAARAARRGESLSSIVRRDGVSRVRLAAVRQRVVDVAQEGLPGTWRDVLALAVPDDGELANRLPSVLDASVRAAGLVDRVVKGRRAEVEFAEDVAGALRTGLEKFAVEELIAPAESVLEEHRMLIERLGTDTAP